MSYPIRIRPQVILLIAASLLIASAAAWSQRQDFPDVPVPPAADALSDSSRTVAARAASSIVSIDAVTKPRPLRNGCYMIPAERIVGTGFVIQPGVILTSSEVIRDSDQIRIRLNSGQELIGTDPRIDPRSGLGIVRIDAPAVPALPLGDSRASRIGDWVLAAGYNSTVGPSASVGIISAIGPDRRFGPGEFLQTDANINAANGGGPLLNLRGEVIGINARPPEEGFGSEGFNSAIPVERVRWIAGQLIDQGSVTRGYLGAHLSRVPFDVVRPGQVPANDGVLVRSIVPDSPAAKAGLQPGDAISAVNGQPIHRPAELQETFERLMIGNTYPVEIVRNGNPMSVNVTVGTMPIKQEP